MRTIAIDLDDTLNNFDETLQATPFHHDADGLITQETFAHYLARIRGHAPDDGDLLSTDYSILKYKIPQECYRLAAARPDGVEFARGLKRDGWRIVICTYRDLRRANDCTRQWLDENGIPFDHLFMASNKIVFCRTWGIEHLVDDDPFNITHGQLHGVNVYYPILPRHKDLNPGRARGFHSFSEIIPWLHK